MKRQLVPFILGLVFIAGAIAINMQQRALQRDDIRDIAGLRAELDSVRAMHARASTAADSASLAETVARRTYLLGRREFHVAPRQEAIDGWWTLTGPGIAFSAVGVLFLAVAVVSGRRGRASAIHAGIAAPSCRSRDCGR